jgi:RNA-directed DNA polymerase
VALRAFFDHVRPHVLLAKVAQRINDAEVMQVRKSIRKASGSKGVPQGGVISPLLSKRYLTAGDRRLERATDVTRRGTDT